ncbi:nicotinate (nicotinamide) nucleotide adenylyltransferase [Sunxiuqinia elliptica]|uniref:Probable nicotinate-nucleotide adenylyltransferase n=1 Tax=Sunxiuqinia elliptica TaxID=655355 RepID=A0A4V3BXK4_9BACT|nr:nicotinate (nicotinamide) nucleotide adenylyltransferase [Sunxiuqinia elliptica]TDN99158.1 nicotinate-nucleotide adenylyltransferase [Sunxiuqinia elliptica]TDO56598.1 nicotinate-nucleotide adenylyltransferase [Sunxiuqinia elliptica]
MKVGLYFGTYNPIHIGHMAIANYLVTHSDIDQLWFVISPQSPFKTKKKLLDNYQRQEMVERAIENDDRFRSSSIEFNLPIPSYTIDTLTYLHERHPKHDFYLIMGADNLLHIDKWKNYELILENYNLLVYPRPGIDESQLKKHPHIHFIQAPVMEISSSFIRKAIAEGKDIRHFLPTKTWEYIDEMSFYK